MIVEHWNKRVDGKNLIRNYVRFPGLCLETDGGRLIGIEDVDFVTCCLCGDRRRVISGRHLSKHETDRATYMEEYGLTRTISSQGRFG